MLKAMMMMLMMAFLVAFFPVAQLCIGHYFRIFGSPQGFGQIQHLSVMLCNHTLNNIATIIRNIAQLITKGKFVSRFQFCIPEY